MMPTPAIPHIVEVVTVTRKFDDAEAKGLASIQLDGQFIDYPIVQGARQVVVRGIA